MKEVCRIGLDIAKNYFQAHGVDKHGKQVFSKKLKRSDVLPFFANLPSSLVGLEACGGAHYWAREITRLDAGHTVRLISPRRVKPFVINNKNDAADAAAICEVVGIASTRFVNVRTVDQQDLSSWHRIRERKVKERTALVNQIRSLLNELGIIIPQGITHVRHQLPFIIGDLDNGLTVRARKYLSKLHGEFTDCDVLIAEYESEIKTFAKTDEACKRIQQIPGVGPITATAIVAHVGLARHFKNGRAFAAYLGLTPKEHSSGGKQKLLGISKRGNSHIRWLLVQGARIVTRYSMWKLPHQVDQRTRWVQSVVGRRGKHVASVALANKTARIIWALLARGEEYKPAVA
jgi:transposase